MQQLASNSAGAASIARRAGEGPALSILGATYVLKATSAETGNGFCCIEHTVAPGTGVPPHTHANEDETFYVVEGEIVFEAADQPTPLRLGPGSFFYGPRHRQHAFRNEGKSDARMLVFIMPGGGLEQMFRDIDAAGGTPRFDELVAIAGRAGVTIAA